MFYTTPYRTAPGGCCAPFVPLAGKTNNQERNKNMKTNRKAAVLALGLALLAPLAGAQEVVDSEWWNVNFDGSFQEGFEGLTIGELGALTNNESKGNVVQPYASGVWEALDGDESYVTNECYPSASGGTNWCIKLDTQGNDLTWTPTNEVNGVTNIYQKIALVDADLYLVGSDSAPDPADFDATADVQSAIFLKNETDEDSGETTNSILCVYVTVGKNTVWQELEGRAKTPTNDIPDNAWYRVTVLIDHQTNPGTPMVEVYVDGIPLHARGNPAMTSFMAANTRNASTVGRIQSVSFRGTGAIDNFVGKTREKTFLKAYFKAVAYLDNDPFPEMDQTTADMFDIGGDLTPEFTDFYFDDYPIQSYALSRVEIEDFATPTTMTFQYGYDKNDEILPLKILEDESTNYVHVTMVGEGDGAYQQGDFSVEVPSTAGATQPENYEDPATAIPIVRIYYKTVGAFYANAVTEIGDNVATNGTLLKPVAAGGTYPTNLVWTFPATDGANVLTGVKVENGATATYDSATRVATATVTLATALETNKTFVTATYAEGSYEGKTPTWIDNEDGTYVLGNYVAKIDGDPKPVYYTTLQAAIAAVQEDAATTTTVTLLASVDEDVTIPLGKNVKLDLNGCAITNVASDTISVYGTLVLTDSSENTNGIVASAIANKAAIVNYPGGNVVIEAGTIAVPDNATYYNIKNMGAMTIEEGAVIVSRVSTASTLIANGWYGNATTDRGTTGQADTAILTINGGMFDGGKNVVKNDDYGILVIEGGSFSNLSDVDAVILNWNDTTINGGEFTGVTKILCNGSYGANSADKGVMTINGGTFRANGEQGNLFGYGTQGGKMSDALLEITGGTFYGHVAGLGDNDGTFGVAAISGGSFSEVVPQIYCAQDFVPVTTADPVTGLYTVKPGSIQVTDGTDVFTYGAFADAIPVHGWGATYTLLTNVEETVTITNAAEKLFVEVGDDADRTNGLEVVTTVEGDAQYAYTVKATLENGVVTYELEQTIRSYDVVWHVEAAESTNQVAYGATPVYSGATPTKDQDDANTYAFDGWAATAGGEKLDPLPAVTGPTNFYAVFTATPRVYTITWVVDGAETNSEAAYNDTPICPVTPAKPDVDGVAFTFVGWAATEGATAADPTLPAAVTGTATYYAVFTGDYRLYTIAYDLKGNLDGVPGDPTPVWSAENYVETNEFTVVSPDIVLPDPVCDGWAFQGWITNGYDAVLQKPGMVPTGSTTNYSFVAEWKEKVTAQFVSDGAEYTNLTVVAGESFAAPDAPTKADAAGWRFAFANWTTNGAVVSFPTSIEETTTFTAMFTSNAIAYTITYVLDGGTNSAANPTNYTVETETFSLAPAGKEGFDFLGWIDESGATNMAPAIAKGSTGDRTFTAAFQAKAPEHVGAAAAENGFMILSPEDPSQPEAPVFTLAPTMNGLNGTTRISASFVKPEGVTSATVKLVYKKSLAADAQKFYADATITNIDLANGTADVAYTLPQDEDTIFLVGFTDGESAGNGD